MSVIVNPRTYVKQVPLPIPSHKGICIQARSQTVYNATVPTRDEVRKENYDRRQRQLTQQGFQSSIQRPYEAIGDPIHLETKDLIVYSLGLQDMVASQKSDEIHEPEAVQQNQPSPPQHSRQINIPTGGYKKEASDLHCEVLHSNEMIQQIKKGHGLFQLALNEQKDKDESAHRGQMQQRELNRMQMRPPRLDSGSENEDSDSEDGNHLDDDSKFASHDTQSFQPDIDFRPFSTGIIISNKSSLQLNETDSAANQADQQRPPRKSNHSASKRHVPQRPYTPVHNNIAVSELNMAPDKPSLFRQLCVIFWLLDTMNADPQRLVRPVTQCWKPRELIETEAERNRRMNTEKTKHDKVELQWKQFSNISPTAKEKKNNGPPRFNAQRLAHVYHSRHESLAPFGSVQHDVQRYSVGSRRNSVMIPEHILLSDSVISLTSDSTSRLDMKKIHDALSTFSDSSIDVGADDSSSKDDSESVAAKELVNASDSIILATPTKAVAEPWTEVRQSPVISVNSSSAPGNQSLLSKTPDDNTKLSEDEALKKLSRREKILAKINRMDEESMWQRPCDELSGFRASARVRPNRTAAVLEFEASAPSVHYGGMSQSMKMKFHEVIKEKEHSLNDRLEALTRDRLRKLENKFTHKITESCADVGLQAMRRSYLDEVRERRKNTNKKLEVYHKWYTDLMNAIPDDIRNSWYCQKMINKIGKYGLVEAGKQSAVKFQRVVSGLRTWELCSPDISAAIEFCRERIIEMSVDEYEAWFRDTFPNVARPFIVSTSDDLTSAGAKTDLIARHNNHRTVKSAPPRLRRQVRL